MLGFNGGLIGRTRDTSATHSVPGVFSLREQVSARRRRLWPLTSDVNYDKVTLLLNGDGSNGSTTITDRSSSPKTITAVGNAQISTTQSKYGGSSIACDGTGDYLSVSESSAFNLGASSEPFTVEFHFYRNATGDHGLFCKGGGAGNWNTTTGYDYYAFIEGGVMYWMWNPGSAPVSVSTNSLPAIQQWHHYAATYDGTTTRLFINGSSVGTPLTSSYTTKSGANRLRIAANVNDTTLQSLNGFIDDLRVTKGVARYTANFTPPTTAFPAASDGL